LGRWLFALAAVMFGLALWLLTLDIYADQGRQYAGDSKSDGTHSSCGSAYDVALLRGDGFMGGEVPENQDLLNRQCVVKASRSVALASGAAVSGLALIACGMFTPSRERSVPSEVPDSHTTTTA
jgi:hypothetical protein